VDTVFHPDELLAQSLARQPANGAAIRPYMPDQHRAFFALLPYLFIATTDQRGWPVASVLAGRPGFVQSPAPPTLGIAAQLAADDPAEAGIAVGREVGLLGLDLTNRRRNRANGRLTAVDARGLTVGVAQSFGNCAQYIQTRRPAPRAATPAAAERLAALDDDARRLISSADTFFVASRSRTEAPTGGLDISHRGGRPGFVDIRDDTLVIPDFRGNRFFNTLGNLLGDPRAGLLFIDFASGDFLQLQGLVAIDWNADAKLEGAQRTWRLRLENIVRRRDAFPFAWTFGGYAPTTLATGTWDRS
jgi:predicted pyridoxine 5'-phosphate oxidase superfamily flavin-nucleotide-binding protein